jgi:hypothetical protein
MAAAAAMAVLIAAGIWFSVTVLFKIDKFDLQGESRYTAEEIAGVFGHGPGDNMYGFSAANAQIRIEALLPYVEQVVIRRRLPSTLVFWVTEAVETFCLPRQGAFAVLSGRMKVLRIAAEEPVGLLRIEGLSGLAVEVGRPLALEEGVVQPPGPDASNSVSAESESRAAEDTPGAAESFEALAPLLESLAQAGFAEVSFVDVGDVLNLKFGWQGRVTVLLGPKSGLGEKLNAAQKLLRDEIGPDETGTLDMSYHTATGNVYWR